MKIEKDCKVKVHYKGTFEDGSVFDSSEGKDPLEFVVGQNQMIPGFEKALIGMDVNEEKDIKLLPSEAYGDVRKELIQEVPKENLPPDLKVQKGTMLMLKSPEGQQLPAKVEDVKEKSLVINLNHPLAGKTLLFHVRVEDVSKD